MIQDPFCYFNGEMKRYSTLHLHVSDLQFQRSFGVFDFFRVRNGVIPWLDDYTDRLFNSMRLSEIESPVSPDEFISLIHGLDVEGYHFHRGGRRAQNRQWKAGTIYSRGTGGISLQGMVVYSIRLNQ